jgi:hypothetical protein
VDPDAHEAVLAASGDGVVEVLGVVGVDREGGQLGEVDAGVGRVGLPGGRLCLAAGGAAVRAVQAGVEHQPFEHVAGHVGAAEPAHHARAALARSDQHQVALVRPAALDGRARAGAEQRLGHEEAPAPLEHRDERLVEAPRRAPAGCGAHSLLATTSSATGSASSRLVRGLS